jgi:hypothetical protein
MTTTDPEADLVLSDGDRGALGAFRSFHPAASGIHKVNIAIASVFTLLPAAGAVWFLVAALRQPGKGMWIGAALFGGLALLPAVGLVYLVLKLGWRLYLFENGFVFVRGSARVVVWDDVQSLYEQQDVVAGIRADRRLRFLLADGRRLNLDSSYRDYAAFARAVREGVARTVLRRAAEALPRGEAVAFGKLLLSKAGLAKPGGSLPWAEVHSIAIEPRVTGQVHAHGVVVYRRGPPGGGAREKAEWYMKLIPSFGNVDAFLQLASQFTRVGDSEHRPHPSG